MPQKSKRQAGLKLFARVDDPWDVLQFAGAGPHIFRLPEGEFRIKMDSSRYHTFAKSQTCVTCGLVGSYMLLELFPHSDAIAEVDRVPHFNLYATDFFGDEVLMTKDHIVPKSQGGRSVYSNLQTMCSPCNSRKADKPTTFGHLTRGFQYADISDQALFDNKFKAPPKRRRKGKRRRRRY